MEKRNSSLSIGYGFVWLYIVMCQESFCYVVLAQASCYFFLISVAVANDFLLAADFTHKRIYQITSASAQVTAVDIQDNFYPTRAIIHQRTKDIFWSDYATRQIRRVSVEGRDSTVIYNGGNYSFVLLFCEHLWRAELAKLEMLTPPNHLA